MMKTGTKAWLVTAAFLVLIGCITFGGVMAMLKWDFTKLSTASYETNVYEIHEDYKSISITAATADIELVISEDSKTSVTCREQKNARHSVAVKDDTLVVNVVDTRKWYEHIGIHFGTPKLTVCIPQGEYGVLSVVSDTGNIKIPKGLKFESIGISEDTGNVTNAASALGSMKIKTTTGNICVENVSAESVEISVSTGRVTASAVGCAGDFAVGVTTGKAYLTDIACKNLISIGSTGDISLQNVIAAEKLSIERSTGDVKFDRCDAAGIHIKTDTGNVTGNLLTDKVFIAQTDTGRVNVPQSVGGGKCEITTNTGDIKLDIP